MLIGGKISLPFDMLFLLLIAEIACQMGKWDLWDLQEEWFSYRQSI